MIKRVEYSNCVAYELNGKDHRPNGPAIIWDNGHWVWGLSNVAHRYYGPSDNTGAWTIHGIGLK